MMPIEYDADHWRSRAQEARAMAEIFTSEEARKHMLTCAESYERLAKLAKHEPVIMQRQSQLPHG